MRLFEYFTYFGVLNYGKDELRLGGSRGGQQARKGGHIGRHGDKRRRIYGHDIMIRINFIAKQSQKTVAFLT